MSLDPVLLLSALHPSGSVFTVSSFGGKELPWFRFVDSPEKAIEVSKEADRLKGREGVYHCVQNLKARPPKGRGSEVDALNVYALWADVDAMGHPPLSDIVARMDEDGKHAKNRAWAEATLSERQEALNAAIKAIESLPIGPPSALVTSGRGYHPYWLLAAASEDLALVKGANARIAELLHADNCADLARVLKIPGTRNRKIASAPEPVTLVRFDDSLRYDLADLVAKLGATPIQIAAPKEKKPSKPAPEIPLDTQDTRVKRATKYVEKIPGGVAGEGGHGQTWKAALAVTRGFELTEDEAYGVLASAYNPRCQPPWSEKELRHKIEDAARATRVPRGYLLRNGEYEKDHDVARAVARFSEEAVCEIETVQELYESEDALRDLAHLSVDDPAAFAAATARLDEKFKGTLKTSVLKAAIKPIARELQAGKRARVLRAEYGSPAAMFPDAGLPVETTMPVYWHCDPVKGLGKEVPSGADGEIRAVTVCPVPVFITSRDVDLSDETAIIELTWPCGPIWRKKSIPRGDMYSSRDIVKFSSADGFPVRSGNAMDVQEFLMAFEHQNRKSIPSRSICSAMGWLKDMGETVGFMCGRTLVSTLKDAPKVSFRGSDGGDDQIVNAVVAQGTMEGWISTVAMMAPYPKAIFPLYAAFAPPLLGLLDAQNFVVENAAPTTSGKSTVQGAAASAIGSPWVRGGGLIHGWNDTKVFIENIASVMNYMPVFLDDTKLANSPEQIAQVVYGIASGIGRGRGSLKGLAKTKSFHTVLLSTGEAPIVLFTKDGGLKARVICLRGLPFGKQNTPTGEIVASIRAGVSTNYGHAWPVWVRWLMDNQDEADDWKAERIEMLARLTDLATDNAVAGRLAEHVATTWITAKLVHRALPLTWQLNDASIMAAWDAALEGAADADVAREALLHTKSWATSNRRSFWGVADTPLTPYFGRWEDGVKDPSIREPYIGFLPSVLERCLKEGGFGQEVVSIWQDRGWLLIDKGNGKRNTFRARIDGDVTRLIAVKISAIDEGTYGEPIEREAF